MAARMNARHQDAVRAKIQSSQLLNRLTNHALGKLKRPMDSSQVTAALGVLRKSLPDLTATELTGKDGERLFDKVERIIRR